MATRCATCHAFEIEYLADGGARCLLCGAVTPAVEVVPPPVGAPKAAATEEPSFLPWDPRLSREPPGEIAREAGILPAEREGRDAWIRRIRDGAGIAAVLSLAFLFVGIPWVLSNTSVPIIHMSDLSLEGDAFTCVVTQYMTLKNTGGRAGVATIAFYVDHAPVQNWSYLVNPAETMHAKGSLVVSDCTVRTYGVALVDVEPY